MYESPHLAIGYLIRLYKRDELQGPIYKCLAMMKAILVGINTGHEWHV
jgi:hypothetical protein